MYIIISRKIRLALKFFLKMLTFAGILCVNINYAYSSSKIL